MGRTYSDVCSVKRWGKSIGRRVWTGAFECDDGGLAFRGLRGCSGGEVDGGEEYGGCGGEELHFRRIEGRVDNWVRCSGTWAWDKKREMPWWIRIEVEKRHEAQCLYSCGVCLHLLGQFGI